MAQLFLAPYFIAWDSNNDPIPGPQIYFTLEGTNTASAPFQDAALSTPHANPVVANPILPSDHPLAGQRVAEINEKTCPTAKPWPNVGNRQYPFLTPARGKNSAHMS